MGSCISILSNGMGDCAAVGGSISLICNVTKHHWFQSPFSNKLKAVISNDNNLDSWEHLNGWQFSEQLALIWGLCQCLLLTLTFWTFDFGVVVGEKCNQQICGLKLWIREGVPNQTGYYDACVCVYALKAHLKFVPSDQRSCSCKLWFLLKVVQSNRIQCILLCYQPSSEQYL